MAIEFEEHIGFIPTIRKAPGTEVSMSYDKEADVLYINFGGSQDASDSELFDNDVIARYDRYNHVIGFTVLHASKDIDSRFSEAVRLSNAY